jgi:hypothetical protein
VNILSLKIQITMSNTEVTNEPVKKEGVNAPTAGSTNSIENHLQAASHHQEAAKHHLEAVKHHEEGNHEKAAQSTVKANGHSSLANDHQKEDAKYHAQKS